METFEIAVQFNSGLTGTLFFNTETAFKRFISNYDHGKSNIIELGRNAHLYFNGFQSTEINRYSVVSIHPKPYLYKTC